MRSLSLFFLAFSATPAFAQGAPMSCWAVPGWYTPSGSSVERAYASPTSCQTTVSNQFYIPVQQLYTPLPEFRTLVARNPGIPPG